MKARGTMNDLASLEQDLAALDLRFFKRIKGGNGGRQCLHWTMARGARSAVIQENTAAKRADEDLLESARGTGMPPGLIHDQGDLLWAFAPTARANCASAKFIVSMLTVGKIDHSVRPDWGCTKP